MAQIPYCANQLSPWARIHYGDEDLRASKAAQAGTEKTGKDKSVDSAIEHEGSWKRRLTNAESKALRQGRRTSFGLSQRYIGVDNDARTERLDREASAIEVERLLHLRRQKMKEAHRKGDDSEVYRLQNLGLFDDIDTVTLEDSLYQQSFSDGTSQSDFAVNDATASQSLVKQGHTEELCWYMKTQQVHGVVIPEDFSNCTVHPTPGQAMPLPNLQNPKLNSASLSSISTSTKYASITSQGPSTKPSTWLESDVSSLHSKASSGPRPASIRSPTNQEIDNDDPFLHVGEFIGNDAKSNESSASYRSMRDSKYKKPTHCVCSNHACRNYLSGKASQHCRNCKVPKPQPEVQDAISRIEEYRESPSAGFDSENRLSQAISSSEMLQEDLMLVEMYNTEMEARCRDGIWWEGWLIVEELKQKGIVGSSFENE